MVPPIPYDVIAGEEDHGTFRQAVVAQFPTLPLDDPALVEYWPVFDATYRGAVVQQAGYTEREQFTAGFGAGALVATAIVWFMFLRNNNPPLPPMVG